MNLNYYELNLIAEALRKLALEHLRKAEQYRSNQQLRALRITKRLYNREIQLMGRMIAEIEKTPEYQEKIKKEEEKQTNDN